MELPQAFLEFSAELGSDFTLVQGAGGNTSIKIDDQLFVKSSGTKLMEAAHSNIFTCVPAATDPYSPIEHKKGTLKPSIETNLHLLMPQKIVAHIHAVSVIAIAVLSEAEMYFEKALNGLSWGFIGYQKPGLPLAEEIGNLIKARSGKAPDILVLGNHGLVVGGETIAETRKLIETVVKRLSHITRQMTAAETSARPSQVVPGFVPVAQKDAHIAANDETSFALAAKGSLYPDHVVFLKRGALGLSPNNAVPQDRETDLILIKGVGAYVPEDAPLSAHEMAGALGLIASLIPENEAVRYLSRQEEDELLDWDAEKFRQSLAQKSSNN